MTLVDPQIVPVLTVVSVTVSITSLAVSLLSYRASGPKIVAHSYISREPSGEYFLRLTMVNRGRAATTVEVGQLETSIQWDDKPWRDIEQTLWPQFSASFPYRLEGHTSIEWSCPATRLMTGAIHSTPNPWFLHVTIGHKRRKLRVSHTIVQVSKVAIDPLR